MPNLFSPYTLKGVTLRNRIVMSPMTMYRSTDGKMDDFHVSYLGARAAGGFGLVFPEQVAITPDGRTSTTCSGIWKDDQIEGHKRVTDTIKMFGGVAAIQLGHTGRKGSEVPKYKTIDGYPGGSQLPPDHPQGWTCRAPSAIPYGGDHSFPVHELTKDEIKDLYKSYADAALRAVDAGYQWLEMHYAHGYLGASFFSPLANQRTDEYGGSLENRTRFHLEALDAVREVWPAEYPLTMRLGADDLNPDGTQFEDAITAIGWMKEHGLDLADISLGFNTDDMRNNPMGKQAFMLSRAERLKSEVDIPIATSWNLGVPEKADEVIQSGIIDLAFLGRPALSNPHWPVWAARELGYDNPFQLVPDDWRWWLENFRGHEPSIGLPAAADTALDEESAA